MLFTDLVGSTTVLERLGDVGAERVRRHYFRLLRKAVGAHSGEEVKSLGDGLMVAFASAVQAVGCAVAIQEAVQRHNLRHPEASLWVRIGMHAGEPMRDEEDFFGTAVVVARRLCDQAAGGQILASELVRGLVDPRGQYGFRPLGPLTLKGLSERAFAWEVAWQESAHGPSERPLPRQAGVLHTRLLIPRVPADALERPELVERILAGLQGRLVAVVAGAGYGKSTLLAQSVARASMPCAWLSCDERIASAGPFLAHLTVALDQRFPGVGAHLSFTGSVEESVADLCNEVLATVSDDFLLVVDDVHALASGSAAHALALLAHDLPPTAHLALSSRAALPLPMTRLWSSGVLELGETALALTEEESLELFASSRMPVDDETVLELHRRTEGWVAGLLLAAQSGAQLMESGRAATGPHFDYLAGEVFGRLPDELAGFLLDTAVLERFSAALADAVTGRRGSGQFIERLRAEHLFTVPIDAEGQWHRYHPLFRAFLLRRLGGRGPAVVVELHRRAGRGWLSAGDRVEAVRHFLQAGDIERTVEALEPIAERMALGPDAETLTEWLDAIDVEHWANRPSFVLAQAVLLLRRGRHEESFAAYERAIDQLLDRADHERAAAVLFRLLQTMVAAGTRPERRIEAGLRYLPRIDRRTRMLPAARLMQTSSYAYGCRFEEAEHELRAAMCSFAAPDWTILQTYATVIRAAYFENQVGRSEEALRHIDEAIADLGRREGEDVLGFLSLAHLVRGYVLTDLGRYDEALADVPRIREVALRRGLGEGAARVLEWVRGVALAALGRWDELEAALAPTPAARGEPSCYAYRSRAPAALLAAHRGDHGAVQSHVRAARAEMADFGLATDRPLVLLSLAISCLEVGLDALAEELADEAVEVTRPIAGWLGARARAALVAASVARDEGKRERLLEEALEVTAEAARSGGDLFELWTHRHRALAAPLLARAVIAGLGPQGLAGQLLAACGAEVLREAAERLRGEDATARMALAAAAGESANADPGVLATLLKDPDPRVRDAGRLAAARIAARPRPALEIVTMGLFSVRRAGVAVAGWRPRARALLAALLCGRGPVHRDVLLEWFWPKLAPERALASFNTTLHELRRSLEPEIRRGGSSLIQTHGESYVLALGPQDRWDAGELLRIGETEAVGSSETLVRSLMRVEGQTVGTFLPEWPYEEWAAPMRDELARRRLQLLARLAEALVAVGQDRSAAVRYQRLIEADPECEGWHRDLMRTYARLGERALALRQYHACRRIFRERLGVEPSQETRDLYRSLL